MVDLLADDALLDLRPRAKPTDPLAVVAEEASLRAAAPRLPAVQEADPAPAPGAVLPAAPAATHPGHPGPAAACHACAKAAAGACASCGRAVCAQHRWTMLALCVGCASEERVGRAQREARPEPRNWLEGA